MKKRILIFSYYRNIQERIEEIVKDYFFKNFTDISYVMKIQKFSDIPESVKENYQVNSGGELLVIFDEHPAPPSLHKNYCKLTSNDKLRLNFLKHQAQMTQNLCNDQNIPYFIYSGEISRGEEYMIRDKLDQLKPDIERRIENLESLM